MIQPLMNADQFSAFELTGQALEVLKHDLLSEIQVNIYAESNDPQVQYLLACYQAERRRLFDVCYFSSAKIGLPERQDMVVLVKQYYSQADNKWLPVFSTSRTFYKSELKEKYLCDESQDPNCHTIRHPISREPIFSRDATVKSDPFVLKDGTPCQTRYCIHPFQPPPAIKKQNIVYSGELTMLAERLECAYNQSVSFNNENRFFLNHNLEISQTPGIIPQNNNSLAI